MRTSEAGDLLDLQRDLPTTAKDVEALQRYRPVPLEDWWSSLQRLADSAPPAAQLQPRPTFAGYEPFEL
jgi:hypothetical protein